MEPIALSIILTGRNDNHNAGFTDRLFMALDQNLERLRRAAVPLEILWVEWNAVAGRPCLAESVLARYPQARAIICGPEIHAGLCDRPTMQFMQYFAKNAGLRRARGRFALVTNGDILLGEEVVNHLARIVREPVAPAIYRATRRDLRPGVGPAGATDPENWQRLNLTTPPYHVEQSGDFILAARCVWEGLGGFNETIRHSELHIDSQFCVQAVKSGFEARLTGDVYHLHHEGSWTHLSAAQRADPNAGRGNDFDYLRDLPYRNSDDWGLVRFTEERLSDRLVVLHQPPARPPAARPPPAPGLEELADQLQQRARAAAAEDFCAAFIAALAQVNLGRRSPVELAMPFLKRYLQSFWEQLLGDPKCREQGVAMYGSGRHTEWLLRQLCDTPGPTVKCILDDFIHEPQTLAGIRVIRPENLDVGAVGAIVISSDVYETVLYEKARGRFGPDLAIYTLYDDLPKGLYLQELAGF